MPAFSVYEILGLMAFATFCVMLVICSTLAAVALGAFLVYKTKREDGELFTVADRQGDAMVIQSDEDDEVDLPLGEDVSQRGVNEALDRVLQQNARFARQSDAERRD